MGKSEPVQLAAGDRDRLLRLANDRNTAQKLVLRARIVLLCADGLGTVAVARRLQTSQPTVRLWRERYAAKGVAGLLKDATRPPGKTPLAAETVARVVEMTLHTKPPKATHWSVRTMAKAVGISHTAVQRIWKAHGLKPHLLGTFKLSNDTRFVEKVQDVVRLYLDPPDKALVFSVDEKSQIQALDRTQPGLPLKKGRAGTMTHDYKRHGTTTLFAALNVATGEVIGSCMKRHRHQEFLRFLRQFDRATPKHLDVHLIVDNYATHKHAKVRAWLARHPRFHFHFTPTSASWLNAVEGFFAKLTSRRLRRGAFSGMVDLQAAINRFVAEANECPRPFIWTADPDRIIEKVRRGRKVLASTG